MTQPDQYSGAQFGGSIWRGPGDRPVDAPKYAPGLGTPSAPHVDPVKPRTAQKPRPVPGKFRTFGS